MAAILDMTACKKMNVPTVISGFHYARVWILIRFLLENHLLLIYNFCMVFLIVGKAIEGGCIGVVNQ